MPKKVKLTWKQSPLKGHIEGLQKAQKGTKRAFGVLDNFLDRFPQYKPKKK